MCVCCVCVIFLNRENRMYEFVFQENVCVCVCMCVLEFGILVCYMLYSLLLILWDWFESVLGLHWYLALDHSSIYPEK